MKDKLILIGGGGHCKSCIDVIEQEGRFEIAGILDVPEKVGTNVLGYPVIGTDDMISELIKEYQYFFITVGQIGSPEIRVEIFDKLKQLSLGLPVIISPRAYVSSHAVIGEGTIVMHHAIVNAGGIVGSNCILNSKCLIEHDAQIENHCHIATGAIINGGVNVGKRSFVGSGVITKQYADIPAGSFIKAQSLIK
jgi:sugar O-acyltransferase (sialic acid O-acetyltransferase NeuD family)